MTRYPSFIFALLIAVTLTGCAALNWRDEAVTSKTLLADGYSRFDDSGRLNVNNRWLSAQQVAKLNAYRGLADQLYFEPLAENKTVGSQVISHEVYRVYLDIYLRSAQATDYRTVRDSLKTTLKLTLTPRFYQCMRGDAVQAKQCIQEDNKLAYSRLGYKTALTTSANLACGTIDCSDQFAVGGFSKDRNPVDSLLLNVGLYDMEWIANTGARTLFNQLLINGFINAL
ncbi:MAG: hypothetical protein M0R33_03980 [Methylomonas sp.]|jgi:hypothetical protein|uniref:hypothetical protein n=1 Tax=Methylomonas sp. TaxID=418 RepID=UPI0025E3016A|nr:hypothetical protein [Methylomonas sp.]MCK9605593.1 hypothetical protein [Methylomonas sp.]